MKINRTARMQQLKNQSFVFIMALLLPLLLAAPRAEAKQRDFNGGVLDEYEYKEVFFLEGYQMQFTGKATVSEKEKKNVLTTTYKLTLTGPEGAKLTRSVAYVSDLDKREDKGQTTSQTSVKSFSEKITINKNTTYTLEDFQFSQGMVSDNRPASDYYYGNIVGRKIYKRKR